MNERPVDRVLEHVGNVRKNKGGWVASCPVPSHGQGKGDKNPSLGISEGDDGRALLNCYAGCETREVLEALGLNEKDLFTQRNGAGGRGTGTPLRKGSTHQRSEAHPEPSAEPAPATLENYAEMVKLPVEFLDRHGLKTIHYGGRPAVRMPYLDRAGSEESCIRFRVALEGKPKVKTRRGDKHCLYGLWKLDEARDAGYVLLVEGESDTQTAWYHGEPAAGIPGANGWKSEWAADLDAVERIYLVVEDEAGEACWQKLAATPELQERLYRVELDDAKDVSELHRQDPNGFGQRIKDARRGATAWLDIAESEAAEQSRKAWAMCADLAESADILAEFVVDLERCRVIGERKNAKLLYLAMTSRLLDKPISVAVKGPSSGGKSHLVKQTTTFFPQSAYWSFSGMSERTLFYTEEPLSHRHLILSEAAGMGGEFQDYVIRTLLSEGFLEYEVVEKTAEGLRPRRLRKEGPTGFITTTTREKLHAENETRYLSLTVSDTREQTRAVYRTLADEEREETDRERWNALQEWLEGAERRVTVPYAGTLAEKMGDVAVRLRRDFSVILNLIKTYAILHQASRERDGQGRIVATVGDYSRIRELVADLVAESVEATVPETMRRTVEAVRKVIKESDEEHATNRDVSTELDVDKAAASRRVRGALDRGYLKNLEDRKGRPARLILGEEMPEDTAILPNPDELCDSGQEPENGTVDPLTVYQGGIPHPPPPQQENEGGGGGTNTPPKTGSTDQRLNEEQALDGDLFRGPDSEEPPQDWTEV